MANQWRSIIIFALAFSLYCPSVLSRSLPHTAQFDVSGSIQRTLDVLSFDPQISKPTTTDQQQLDHTIAKPSSSSSSLISLSVHPRSAIHKTHLRDYETLTLSRLARDSARVHSLNVKLELAVGQFKRSEFRPAESAILQPEDLQTPVTSGISQGSGEYFTRVGVGSPAKSFYMVLDTGSDVSWLQCEPCSDCYHQSDPVFNPSGSSTYSALTCGSEQCSALDVSACRSNACLYQVSYGDGSYTVGEFATETLSFGSSGTISKIAIGCGHSNEGLFVGAAGLFGLGGGALSLPSQLKATSFSYCLVNRDSSSSSTLDFNSARPGDAITAPLLRNRKMSTFFYVGVTGMSVGGKMVSIPASVFQVDASGHGGIIVDSGTAVTRLQTQAYNALRDSFVAMATNLPSTSGFALFDTCFDLSSLTRVSVPVVAFHFGGEKRLPLRPNNFLIPVDSAGKFCFAFAPTPGSLSIIGNVQQQGTRVSYDIANSVVGFSTDKC